MSVDLHRIGLGISSGNSRNGFGNIVSFPSVSFPAYGTYNSTMFFADYLAGAYSVVQYVTYYSQSADYIVKNDGVGGTYTDYATASNILYKSGSFLQTTNEVHDGSPVTLPYSLGTYNTAFYAGYDYSWNGSGGYVQYDNYLLTTYSGSIGPNDYVNSTYTPNYYIVNIAGSDYQNGKYTYYYIAGVGYYNSSDNYGNYYSYGSYITYDSNSNNTYYWDGSGGYYYS